MIKFYDLFKNSYLQTFDDAKLDRKNLVKVCKITDNVDIRGLNDKGAGIFFQPNPSTSRKERDVKAINWVYIDMDENTKPEMVEMIKNSPIRPHIVVESNRSYHLYWNLPGMTREQFDTIIGSREGGGLLKYFNGDEAISSTNEVLRLPGYNHMKDPSNPFKIKVIHMEFYGVSIENMIEAYPCKKVEKKVKSRLFDDDIEAIKNVPIDRVLGDLGTQVSKQNFIIENGKVTSASINIADNYINRFSGKDGSGSTIDAAMVYGFMNKPEAIKYLKDKYLVAKPVKAIVEQKDDFDDPIEDIGTVYTWGTVRLDKQIAPIQRDQFIILGGLTNSGKTTFVLDFAIKNAKIGNKVLFLTLEQSVPQLLTSLAIKSAGITKSEWRDKATIPKGKRELYYKKKESLKNNKNIILRGTDKTTATTANIFKLLDEVNPDLTIVDNFDLIAKDGKNEYAEQTRVADEIMAYCREKRTPIVVIHHKNPRTNYFRGSGKLLDNADGIIECSREWDEEAGPDVNAKFTLLAPKDRVFGEWVVSTIFFYKGSFYDEYPGNKPYESTEFWQNK